MAGGRVLTRSARGSAAVAGLPRRAAAARAPRGRAAGRAQQAGAARVEPLPEQGDEGDGEGEGKGEGGELALAEARGVQQLEFALSPEGVALQLEAAADLEESLRASRRSSFAAVAGRAPANAVFARPAAARIVDLLLSIEDGDELDQTVTDALTPPDDAAEADTVASDDEDAVWTTPLLLLQAVDARLREVEGGVSYNDPRAPQQIGGGGGVAPKLKSMRKVVLARCPEHVRELEG